VESDWAAGSNGAAGSGRSSGPARSRRPVRVDCVGSEGVPDTLASVGKLLLPAGKYAILAKIQISFHEHDSDAELAECRLIAESDVDLGTLSGEGGEGTDGVISLTLLHEFADEGFAEVACADFGSDPDLDFSDGTWTNLRITAIKVGELQNGPLLQ